MARPEMQSAVQVVRSFQEPPTERQVLEALNDGGRGLPDTTRNNAVDILGVGAQKSATSWAAHVLNLHDRVFIPQSQAYSGKEVNFFSGPKWEKGVGWYAEIMTPPRPNQLSLDVSPAYAKVGEGKIQACHKSSPDARVFFLMRNPIHRDWSSLVMQAGRRGFPIETASFVDIMVFYDAEKVDEFSGYDATIRRWRKYYGDQLLIALYDDVRDDSHAFYEKLCAHVGLRPDDVKDWRTKIEKKIFEGPGKLMPEQMFEFLSKKYKPLIERLNDLIGRDVGHWLKETPSFRSAA